MSVRSPSTGSHTVDNAYRKMSDSVEVVISGIGGLLPESKNIEEFSQHLLANRCLIKNHESRWKKDEKFNLEPTLGLVGGVGEFDYKFFGFHRKISTWTDPLTKLGLEMSLEAIIDAGISPSELRGTNTQVYVSTNISDFEASMIDHCEFSSGYVIMGHSRAMYANRISYFYDLRGTSCAYDGAWTWGQLGIQMALRAIRSGECDGALVLSGNVVWHPNASWQLGNLGFVSADGLCHSFGSDASGGIRSDSSMCVFLQRADMARRCYARVVEARSGSVVPRLQFDPVLPSPRGIEGLIREVYEAAGEDPSKVHYLEGDGCGVKLMEEAELNACTVVLCRGRSADKPLLVGSVKSNIGNVEPCAGFASLVKLIVAMESGTIPANLNHGSPNPNIPALVDGRMKVITKNTPLPVNEDPLLGATTLGMAGTVGHVLVRANLKNKCIVDSKEPGILPRLVLVSGRSEDSVVKALDKIKETPFDPEFLRLTQDVFSTPIRGYEFRGFNIVPSTESPNTVQKSEYRPLWYVYSGMGSQWAGMGTQLLALPIFSETIARLHQILAKQDVDLTNIITDTGPEAFDNILKSFVGITAIQIALTNVLTAMGLKPDGIIGHSVGEVACSYADGCLTEEQTILAAYARGKASNDVELIKGMMAAVGLGYADIKDRLPPNVEVACRNSSTSCTLSGPASDVNVFVKKLKDEGVFARAVNVSDIAYHSHCIQPAGPFLRKYLQEVITDPKPRSERWVSTSVPQDQWDTPRAQFCSAEYHTNNLLSPVLFEEGLKSIPADAVLVELAPHGLLQAIVKRAMPDSVNIALTQRNSKDGLNVLLQAVGRIYLQGPCPRVSKLYPDIQYPVARGTPSLAPLVSWDHSERNTYLDMPLPLRAKYTDIVTQDASYMELSGITVRPVSAVLMAVIVGLAEIKKQTLLGFPVTFENVVFADWMHLPSSDPVSMVVSMMTATGRFEVYDDKERLLARGLGTHREKDEKTADQKPPSSFNGTDSPSSLDALTVYDQLETRGLVFSPDCRALRVVRPHGKEWSATTKSIAIASVLESMMQVLQLIHLERTQELSFVTRIQRLDVYPRSILANDELDLVFDLSTGTVRSEGLFAAGITLTPRRQEERTELSVPRQKGLHFRTVQANFHKCEIGLHQRSVEGPLDYVGSTPDGSRVMGLARRVGARLEADPLLCWKVPTTWTDEQASTVPYAYSMALFAIKELAKLQSHESVLIHCGMSAIGQAVLRITLQEISDSKRAFVTVTTESQKTSLMKAFPTVPPGNVFVGDDCSFEWLLRRSLHASGQRGVGVVLGAPSGQHLSASMQCCFFQSRVIYYGRQDMEDGSSFGMQAFLKSVGVYGLTGDALFKAKDVIRRSLAECLTAAIKSGVAQPVINCPDKTDKLARRVIKNSVDSVLPTVCEQDKVYVIIGGSAHDWLQVAGRLALLGARLLVVHRLVSPSQREAEDKVECTQLVRHQVDALRKQFGTEVRVENSASKQGVFGQADFERVLKNAAKLAGIDALIVFANEKNTVQNAIAARKKLCPDAAIMVLRPANATPMAVRRDEQDRRFGVVSGPVHKAVDVLGKLLAGNLPCVIDLSDQQPTKQSPFSHDLPSGVPTSFAGLRELHSALPVRARLRELPTLGPRCIRAREVFPLVAIPPLGVLDGDSIQVLRSLASGLLVPLLCAEIPDMPSVEKQATAIARLVLDQRRPSPCSILSWGLGTPLALLVSQLLEAEGVTCVTFLVDGDVLAVESWAREVLRDDDDLVHRPQWLRFEADRGVPEISWMRQRLAALAAHSSRLQQPKGGWIHHFRSSPRQPCSLFTGYQTKECRTTVRTITPLQLESPALASTINDSSAWSRIASEKELRSISKIYQTHF